MTEKRRPRIRTITETLLCRTHIHTLTPALTKANEKFVDPQLTITHFVRGRGNTERQQTGIMIAPLHSYIGPHMKKQQQHRVGARTQRRRYRALNLDTLVIYNCEDMQRVALERLCENGRPARNS